MVQAKNANSVGKDKMGLRACFNAVWLYDTALQLTDNTDQ